MTLGEVRWEDREGDRWRGRRRVSTEVPAGWYPIGDGRQRYWDGAVWTDHTAPLVQPPAQSPHAVAPFSTAPYSATAYSTAPYPAAASAPASLAASPAGMPMGQVVVQAKNPGVSALCSFFLPGLGQFINGDSSKGILFLIGYVMSWLFVFIFIGIPMLFVVWVWGMVDAYSSAKAWNFQRGIIS